MLCIGKIKTLEVPAAVNKDEIYCSVKNSGDFYHFVENFAKFCKDE